MSEIAEAVDLTQAGLYYQDFDQEFHAWQYAINFGLLGPDPITGNGYDYDKHHYTTGEVKSVFVAGYWDITDTVELTAGLRYTEEEKDGYRRVERSTGSFYRRFALPDSADPEKITAHAKNGVLEIEIDKTEKTQLKKIKVRS